MNYDWKKTAKKFGIGLIYLVISFLVYVLTDDVKYGLIVPTILIPLQNFIKHKFDITWL
jgi:hypothetical protein